MGRRFAQPYAKARLLFDHPHSYREWNIVGQYDVPGFFYLESRFRLNPGEQPAIYTAFELCLHECQFEKRPMSRLNLCKLCGGLPRIDKFKPPASDWVYLVECSSKDCDNAEFGDTPEEATRLWNFASPDWDGNVPVR